ncbi:MAG: hypothetical protein O9256_01985 [Rhizobiaceae bacterium]|nr:hypothetical protein [Rhizobiaceae bacterium]MCZ8349852.1 hypothetical protein [Rhizobium sp.]
MTDPKTLAAILEYAAARLAEPVVFPAPEEVSEVDDETEEGGDA